ncbi:MAG: hypothetical protein ACK4PI_04290 [Tepidisphaerales bacterium]
MTSPLDPQPPKPPSEPPRTEFAAGPSGLLFATVLVACVVLALGGLWLSLSATASQGTSPGLGLVLLGVGLMGAVLTALAYLVYEQLLTQTFAAHHEARRLHALLAQHLPAIERAVEVIREQQLLSDKAKSVAFREKDREALRKAIAEDLARGDFEAARRLVDDMEATFGYRIEAERLRAEIARQQNEQAEVRLREVQREIDRLCGVEDWAGAHHQATRFISEHGDFEPARRLPAEIDARRAAHKKQLLDRWNECVLRHDHETGMQVLRQLDPYLTPAESERLAEGARALINERKAALREAFRAAVERKDWAEAVRVGEVIVREFPNAVFAREIAASMDTLKANAAAAAGAEVASSG